MERDVDALCAADGRNHSLQPESRGAHVYCYRTGYNHHTCLLLSEQSEADFLLHYGSEELNVSYQS